MSTEETRNTDGIEVIDVKRFILRADEEGHESNALGNEVLKGLVSADASAEKHRTSRRLDAGPAKLPGLSSSVI